MRSPRKTAAPRSSRAALAGATTGRRARWERDCRNDRVSVRGINQGGKTMKYKAGLIALALSGAAFAQTQGVSKGELVIGTMQDLSGPIVAFSKQLVAGMNMRVDEINANGGINGRKLKLVVEDHGYDPKKAVLATQKLVQKDRIFALVGPISTPTAMASVPILFDKNIPHLFPLP